MSTPTETQRKVRRLGNDVDSMYEILSDHSLKLDGLKGDVAELRHSHGAKLDEHAAKLDSHGAKLDILVATQAEILELLR